MSTNYSIDLHCHPTLKPYNRSFPHDLNSSDPKSTSSVWYSQTPTVWAKFKNIFLTITQFTQADFSTLLKGNVRIVCFSLSPLEKGFFVSRFGDGKVVDYAVDLITGVGTEKVEFVQENINYFSELMKEYNFLIPLNNQPIDIDGKSCKYILVNHFSQIEANMTDENVVLLIPTIEGTHAFCEDNNQRYDEEQIIRNIQKVKLLEFPPLFISLSHHFYNEIAGHAYSLGDGMQKLINQSFGADTSITGLGLNVLKHLLDNSQGKRILPDIKHMSRLSRMQFYALLETPEYNNQTIPIIVSHGAVNGLPTVYSADNEETDNGLFYRGDVNFYDDELVVIAKSGGLFGLQLDERRIVSKSRLKKIRYKLSRKKMLIAQSKLLWNQVEHIAKVLDKAGQKSWDIISIGSDFDGVVNPLKGFWTASEFPMLAKYLLKHAHSYLNSLRNTLSAENRDIKPEELIDKIFKQNALDFFKRNLQ
jgi:hypothetical protein